MAEYQINDRQDAPTVIITVDNNSRVHAAQVNALKYLTLTAFCSIVPFFIFLDFKQIQDPDFILIFGGIISFFISMLLPTSVRFVFRYIIPVMIIPFAGKCENSEIDINTSYFCKQYEQYKDFTLFLLPMFYSISAFKIRSVFGLFVILFQRWLVQFRTIRIIGFIILCFVNAVIFSYLIYLVMIYILYGWFYFLVRTDLHNSTISVEVMDILRNKDYVLGPLQPFERTMSWEIYESNASHSWNSSGFDAKFDKVKLPVCTGIYYRVEGEDVDITCNINNTNSFFKMVNGYETNLYHFHLFDYVEWNLGPTTTIDSCRMKASTKHEAKINLEMTLRITDLSAECLNREIELWAFMITRSEGKQSTIKVKFGSFFIYAQKEIVKFVHVPQGHILSLNGMSFHSFSNAEDQFVFHNISSIANANISGDTNGICSDIFQGCGPMIHFLYNKSKLGNFFNENAFTTVRILNSYLFSTSLTETGVQTVESYTCVCENSYGQHTYSILRNLFNTSSQTTYMSEIKLPFKFVVLPRGLTYFASNKYTQLQNEVRKALAERENDWSYVWRYYVDDERFYYFIITKLEHIIITIIFADIFLMIGISFKVYCKFFVHHLAKIILKPIFPMSICDELLPVAKSNIGDYAVEENVTHDIMIVANDNDYDFAVQKLIPCFTDLGLSVLLPQTDINGGQSNINGYSQAVVTSVMYVVVGTRDFEKDSWNNNFILSNLILPQMYEQQRNQHRILIIKFNDVNIPRPLRWNEHVSIANWSTRQSDDDNFRRLKNKLKSMTEALFMT